MFEVKVDTSEVDKNITKLAKKSPKAIDAALAVAGIQFLTWCNTGSSKQSRTPPIRRGFLRGSGSVFVGNTLVGKASGYPNDDALGSYSGGEHTITWVYNANYATKMHETTYELGPYSAQAGNAGNKWLELHLQNDKELLMSLITTEFEKALKK